MKKITLWLFALFTCWQINAQVAYTHGWEPTGLGSWTTAGTGTFARSTTTPCTGSASARANVYYNGTNTFTSPLLGTSNGGLITFGFDYKVTLYSANTTGAPAAQVQIAVQWSTSTTGPWNTLETINSSNHVVSSSCANKSYTFVAPVGNVYVRFLSTAVGASSDLYYYYDNISVSQGAAPSCFSPVSMTASSLTASSAVITWPAVTPTPGVGYEYYYSNTNVAPTGAGTATTALTENLSGLTSNTMYYVWLRSDCGSGDFSAWSGPFSFKTACVSFSVPFTEGFNASSSSQDCWTVLNVNGDGDAWDMNYASTPIEGDQSAILYTDGNGGANNDYLISPRITLNGNQRLVFKYKVQSTGEPNDFEILLSTTGNAATDFTTTLSPLTSYSNTTVETKVISLAGTSGDVYLAWHVPAGGLDGWRLYIDEVVVEDIPAVLPTCSTITSPTTGAINVSNSTVTWTSSLDATGYYINAGFSGSGSTEVFNLEDVGNVLSYAIPTDPGTTYHVTVIPYNASGQPSGCMEINFTTCGDIGDFSENFDALTATGQIPSCWSRVISNGASAFASVGASTTNNSAPYSISLYNSDSPATANIMLVTPYINNIDAGTNRLRFFARNSTASQDIQVGTMSNPADASTFTVLQTVDLGTTFQEYSVSFAGYTGTDKYIAIRRLSTSTYTYVYIDNVVWEPIPAVAPTCSTITSPTTGAINVANSVVTWTSSTDATGYYINAGFSGPGSTDVLNLEDVGNVLSYAIPTDPGTTYHVTVIPYNASGQPTGCMEINFTTCDVLTPDVLETFDTFLPSCWQEADNGDLVSGPATFGAAGWFADGFGNVGTTGSIAYEIWLASANDWIISPVVSIPATGYELKFDAAATQWDTTAAPTTPWEADDFVQVLISTTGTDNWIVLDTYNSTNVPATTGTTNIIDLDAYAGMDVRFAYRVVEGTANGGADLNFYVDNFEVRLTPATEPSCATNIVATPNATCGNFANSITWDATSGADGYFITVGTTTGGTDVANNVDLGNVLSYNFTGTIGTTYYYTILPYNGVGPATGCTEMSFTTNANGCYCTSAPTSVDGSGITNVQIVTTDFPSTVAAAPFYNDFTATPVDMSQGISNNVQIAFNTSFFDYNTVIWIDFNDDFNFAPSEIVYTGLSSATSPNTLNASFVMPGTAPLGQHRMRIVATDGLQTPSNPCYSASYGETADFTINIVAASCAPAAIASSTVTPDCANAQFSVAIDVTALGSGTPSITDGTTTWPIAAVGVVNVGPFADGSSVSLTVLHGSDATCNLPLGSFTYSCPPANDDCANAIAISAMPYTNSQNASAATGPVVSTCAGMNDGVWYTVVGNGADIIVELSGVTGWDPEIGVYTGSCGTFTCVGSVDDGGTGGGETYTITASTAGTTYFINLGHYNGFSDSPEGPLTLNVTTTLSSGSFDNANFVAYPNPVKDIFNVSYSSEISSVRVMNLLGQEVITREVNATSTQIDMSQLSSGAYIVNVTVGDTIKTIKVVKQ